MNLLVCRLLSCAAAGVLDQLFADPGGAFHPICLIGRLIAWVETHTRPLFPRTKGGERAGGVYLAGFVLLVVVSAVGAVTSGAYRIHPLFGVAAESVLIFFALAEKSLERESYAVYRTLNTEGLSGARHALSRIVGRDTASLSEEGVIKAAVETVAENTSDGVIAPMLFAFVGGAPFVYFYKAVNTMDSMVGYRNEKYRDYGTAAARLDDVLNYFPARLSALFMLSAAALMKCGAAFGRCFLRKRREKPEDGMAQVLRTRRLRDVWGIYRTYRRSHASPNSGQTESVMAGALGVELAGDASYFGEIHHKPVIGERTREVERADILRAISLLRACTYLFWLCGLLTLEALWLFL